MMGNIQAMLWLCVRATKLQEEGKATMGHLALCKSWCSRQGREVVSLARELLGGNGLLLENKVMKSFLDMEVMYTYEGSYDINQLIAGRELTGLSAFK